MTKINNLAIPGGSGPPVPPLDPPMTDSTSVEASQYFSSHYENLPMQYTEIFLALKIEHFQLNFFFAIFLIFAQNIDCGYTLEPPRRGGSNEYPRRF